MGKMETMKETNMEVENMVRKAETLESLDELGLSDRTLAYIKRMHISLEDVVLDGRITAFYGFEKRRFKKNQTRFREYCVEVAHALDEAGFIQKGLTSEAYNLVEFVFYALYSGPYEYGRIDRPYDNQSYEEFRMTTEQYELLEKMAKTALTDDEFKFVTWDYWTSKRYNHGKLKRKLASFANDNAYELPKIFHPGYGKLKGEVYSLINALESIKKFKGTNQFIMTELLSNLENIGKNYYSNYEISSVAGDLSEPLAKLIDIPVSYYQKIIDFENKVFERLVVLSKLPFVEARPAEDYLRFLSTR